MAYIPSPATGEGRVGVKMRYGLLPYSLWDSPHPNLGATASAEGPLGPVPRAGVGGGGTV
jgi:hypothetical protein